jgi:hypothetical protein
MKGSHALIKIYSKHINSEAYTCTIIHNKHAYSNISNSTIIKYTTNNSYTGN